MVYRRTGRPTGRPKKDRTAELMEAAPDRLKMLDRYRARPSDWLKDCINIDPAHYRNESELVRWLETQPLERHEWCRRQLEAGTLILDPSRSYQEEFLDTMAAPGQYAFQCANGTAKTATASLAVLWFLDCYPSGRVLTTAGTWSQLKEQLWREIPMWSERVKKAIVPMGQHVNKMGISIGPDWAAFSRAANRAETFEGVHSDYLMVLIDEAKAVKEEIFGSVRRILRGNPGLHFWFICLSSPGSPGGPFWDITNGEQAHRWTTFHLSAYESERISLDQIGQDAEDLGEDSPLFIAMDIGEFPQEGDDTVIPLSWAQANVDRKVLDTGPRWLGIDVARYGRDESCMFGLFGRRALLQAAYNGRDTVWTSGRADELHQQYKYQRIVIDDGGIGGAVTDQLKARGFPIVPVSFGGKEGMLYPDRYVNIKAEIYWMLRLELESGFVDTNNPETGLSLPNDKKLIHQLASQSFSYDLQGRRKMESHAQLAARGVRSPDRADALVLANYGRTGMMARYGSQVQKAMEDSISEGKSMGIAASLIKDMG